MKLCAEGLPGLPETLQPRTHLQPAPEICRLARELTEASPNEIPSRAEHALAGMPVAPRMDQIGIRGELAAERIGWRERAAQRRFEVGGISDVDHMRPRRAIAERDHRLALHDEFGDDR